MKSDKIYRLIASRVEARLTCIKTNNEEWKERHESMIQDLVTNFLPSGSGWDNGTRFDFENSTGEKLVFFGGYHHMNDGGYYDGWTEHVITVVPSLVSLYTLKISGRNRNDIKDHLYQTFEQCLSQVIYWHDSDLSYHSLPEQKEE